MTLCLLLDCWFSSAIFSYPWNFCLSWTNFLPIFYGSESMLRFLRETKWLCFLVQVTRPHGLLLLLLLLVSGTFPATQSSHLWQAGSYFLFPRCISSCFIFSINVQMLLLNRFFFFQHILFFPELLHSSLSCHLLCPSPSQPGRLLRAVAVPLNLVGFSMCQLSMPQLWRGKRWLSAGGHFQNEVPADSQMLPKSGRVSIV